ncbi:MAG: hypothetical protein F2693_04080 [Actinobacteria bacterium]|nr:hypothetical protein [Actinomycetota bacterium]
MSPKRARRPKGTSALGAGAAASPDEKVAPTQGKIDDDVLETFTPEGKELVKRVLDSTDLIIVVERAPQGRRSRKTRA